ncbi:LysR family transcriptional regulator [Xanthomonas hyacinthi]|uniref:Biotin transporter BioY n=1 Tax=Xanthomonas hyacinthi TaxID=56455 RepID=A0A2S7EVZ2_9XANT|nr:LysR substrate-binding domain-containing protein [Xanthomonas hyacinthi]KLD79934.1 biotin transporter BioY [Xanthomonas hyacinthi DSM 19077]PPU97322.1 biotin transporter BioY [Xanthomonas hyacinthi]QGY76376.1 LysR family transcriptional regulator [Xanthomonas hyacinthi]
MARPPLHALQGFVSVARLGNLSRAAIAMHLTVSALSHQMRTLEQRLGYRLLDRHARGVTLTADGRRLLERIGPHLDAIGEALQPFAARRDNVLTISLTPSMASAWLVPRLGDFLARHPQIEINLLSDQRLVDFERQPQIDAALRIGSGQWPGVVAEALFDEWLVPMASPALIARMGTRKRTALAQWPLLGDPDGEWERWFAAIGETPPARYVAVFDDSESHHRAALDGVGVALGRITRARLLIDSGQLVPLSPHLLKTAWSHYLVYPPRSAAHGGFLAFRDWLRMQAAEHLRRMQEMATQAAPKRRRARG